ncbi:hypothetical protein OESDEN_08794 [Oesophagostomum dentatum]|uniref:Abnormal cell migration protein 18-like fibronectin type I domain-containing protein n=1 Tax=Oesophagostomum dentatum TaxID=61180 RepID=A0A0B1T6A8_OESDE|nr:hypothetical protein OESDEN_08794 [Oesophagostomum dentatum]
MCFFIKRHIATRLVLIAACIGLTLSTCEHEGKQHQNGDEWISGKFKLKCISDGNGWKVEVVSCHYGVEIEPNGEQTLSPARVSCKKNNDGSVQLSWQPENTC